MQRPRPDDLTHTITPTDLDRAIADKLPTTNGPARRRGTMCPTCQGKGFDFGRCEACGGQGIVTQ